MTVENDDDLRGLMAAGKLVGETLQKMASVCRPGITTGEIDAVAAEELHRAGARPAPFITYGFPGVACISVNDEAAHGIPGRRRVQTGDLVKLDLSLELGGYFADAAITVMVPELEPRRRRLCAATQAVMQAGIGAARAGRRVSVIGRAAEDAARKAGFRIVRELPGHGLGRALHEEPGVPTFFDLRARATLHEGLVITVEPHVALGGGQIYQAGDGWTLKTRDGGHVANFEHTIVVTSGDPIIVTAA